MKIKRGLYLAHRWFGVAMCLFIFMWFVTGIVMMYVAFPTLTPTERLNGLPILRTESLIFSPDKLIQEQSENQIKSLRLTTILGRPAYLLSTIDYRHRVMFADNGGFLDDVNSEEALIAANIYYSSQSISTEQFSGKFLAKIDVDQWTVSNSLDHYRPLQKVALNDSLGTQVYISTQTGEVVRDTTRHERVWNWLGANLHWIYPVVLRQHASIWHWVVVLLSIGGILSVLSGGIIGLLRLRMKNKYRGKNVTPYQGVMKLHHLLGLACFTFLSTYIVSGLFSMNPFGVFTSTSDCQITETKYKGTFPLLDSALKLNRIKKYITENPNIRELRIYWIKGSIYPIAVSIERKVEISNLMLDNSHRKMYENPNSVVSAVTALASVRDATPKDVVLLDEYDNYYYAHDGAQKPLPAFRIKMNDLDSTWVYINAKTGEWLTSKTQKQRVQRWLYNGLHSLDFTFLINRRPLWDVVVIVLACLGITMSLTGIFIGARRLG